MILIGIGSNVQGSWGAPRETVARAWEALGRAPCRLVRASSVLETTPFGNLEQPNFVNAVALIETALDPAALLCHLQSLEREAGRVRAERWGPRTLDLDILDYDGLVREAPPPILPHPGIAERQFVLAPIAEIAPAWRHPVSGRSAADLLAGLAGRGEGAVVEPG